MSFEIGDLLGTAYRSEDNVSTVLDDESITPTMSITPTIQDSGNLSGASNVPSTQTDQRENPFAVLKASAFPTSVFTTDQRENPFAVFKASALPTSIFATDQQGLRKFLYTTGFCYSTAATN